MTDKKVRLPSWDDVLSLCGKLDQMGVEYALIGGSALSVYGYERQTKDVDFFFPRDEENTKKLVSVIKEHPLVKGGFEESIEKSLLHGVSTSIADEVLVDLLFVAADREFEDLKQHVVAQNFHGMLIRVMDLEGLLMTKETPRPSDRADRANIQRALQIINEQSRNALMESVAPGQPFRSPDLEHGLYEGRIVAENKRHLAQAVAGEYVIHEKARFPAVPKAADEVSIRYSGKVPKVSLLPDRIRLVGAGRYVGPVVALRDSYVVQDAGHTDLVAHALGVFDVAPQVGEKVAVDYKDGKVAGRIIISRGKESNC